LMHTVRDLTSDVTKGVVQDSGITPKVM
jgi:hypothetical protein